MTTLLISETTTSAKTRREKRRTVLGFLIFSAFSIIGCFILDASPLSTLFLIGAFFCAGLAIYAWLSVLKDWTPDEEGEYFGALFFWTVALVISWWTAKVSDWVAWHTILGGSYNCAAYYSNYSHFEAIPKVGG